MGTEMVKNLLPKKKENNSEMCELHLKGTPEMILKILGKSY